MRTKLLSAIVALAALLSSPAWAREWIVAPGGNDRSPGTLGSPLKTVAAALDRAQPGDSVLLRGGAYDFGRGVWVGPDHGGREGAPVRIQAYGGEEPKIVGSDRDCVFVRADWVVVEGLTCHRSGWNGMVIYGAANVTLKGNKITGSWDNGIAIFPGHGREATNNLVEGNEVGWSGHRSKTPELRAQGGWPQGINIFGDDNTVRGNRVHHTWGEGIGCRSERCAIEHNRVETSMSVGIYLDGASGAWVEGNVVVQDGDPAFKRGGYGQGKAWRRAVGIQLAAEKSPEPLRDIDILNNVVVAASSGIYYGHYGANPGLDGVRVWHNTIVDPQEAALFFERIHGQGIDVRGNIFYRADRGQLGVGYRMSGVTFAGNAWYGQTMGRMRGAGDVAANPSFVGGRWDQADSYRLQGDSPLLDKAPTNGLAADHADAPRWVGAGPDMGALERQ